MGEKWVSIELVEDETLRCNSCRRNSRYDGRYKQKVYLSINISNEIDEVMCDRCWKKEEMEK